MDARLILAVLLCLPLACAGFEHDAWDALLRKHVVLLEGGRASQLSYAAMAQERPALKSYLEDLSRVTPAEFARWPRAEQMAFLINAYDAFTVEKILTRYPGIRSIWDFGRLIGNPFKDRFFVLLGDKRSLDWIEHETLRKNYGDPRVRIFDWFRQDFEPREKYFARYADVLGDDAKEREAIRAGGYSLHFLDYDWSLNDFRSSSRP